MIVLAPGRMIQAKHFELSGEIHFNELTVTVINGRGVAENILKIEF